MKSFVSLALAAGLAGCALSGCTLSGADPASRIARTDAMLARAEAGFAASRALAALFAPWVPPAQAARLRRLEAVVESTLAVARRATDLAARHAALRRAEAATAAYRLAAGG